MLNLAQRLLKGSSSFNLVPEMKVVIKTLGMYIYGPALGGAPPQPMVHPPVVWVGVVLFSISNNNSTNSTSSNYNSSICRSSCRSTSRSRSSSNSTSTTGTT